MMILRTVRLPEQDDPAQLDVPSYEYDTEEHPEEEAQTVKES